MTTLNILVRADAVNDYLIEHDLASGSVPLVAALAQYGGVSNGQPALLLIIEVDGRKVVAKTTLELMETACSAMRAASGMPRSP